MTQSDPSLLYGVKDFLEYPGGFLFSVCPLTVNLKSGVYVNLLHPT